MNKSSKTVFVGLSGGVDSSVAALRLKKQGYDVVGVFIKVWHPDFLDCNWEAERLDAMRVAAHLDIPFLMCDAEEAYKKEVADYFINEYKIGRTPNPDVMCNKAVKFGAFLDFALAHGADYVATGHYAQNIKVATGNNELFRGRDQNKDQTYFLWTLTQTQLQHILFPVGISPKADVRTEAKQAGIPIATKKDSQGVCFLGHIDIPDFLAHFIELRPGAVLDTAGNIIGEHKGALVYTSGQRHGFSIHTTQTGESAHYVVDRNLQNNTITVDTTIPTSSTHALIQLKHCNYINWTPHSNESIEIQTRYRQKPISAQITSIDDLCLTLQCREKHDTPTAGQSCVLYKEDRCLGGGIIS